jgi:hypothetical protein
MGIALVPVMVRLGAWGRRFLPASDALSVRIEVLERGGPPMWVDFMDELRRIHLCHDAGSRQDPTVHEQLQAAYDGLVAE